MGGGARAPDTVRGMLTLVLATRLALAVSPDEYAFVDEHGEVQDVLAAYAFLSRPVALEELHEAAVRRDAHAAQVWASQDGLEGGGNQVFIPTVNPEWLVR